MALGCLYHPLMMQNTTRIVVVGLMTDGQAEHAVQELLTKYGIMEQDYKRKVRREMNATLTEHMNAGNEYNTAKKILPPT